MADKKAEAVAARLLFLPMPMMGHLVPMVELAKRILQFSSQSYHFSITILSIQSQTRDPQLSSYISAVSTSVPEISFLDLPHVDSVVLPGNPGVVALFCALVESIKPIVKSTIQESFLDAGSPSAPVAAIVLDMFCADIIDVAGELGIPPFIFYSSGAGLLSLSLYLPTLDATLPPDKDMDELHEDGYVIDLPGFSTPLPPIHMPFPVFGRKIVSQSYSSLVRLALRYREAKGILVNTFAELEPGVVEALEQGICIPGDHPTPPIYTVGPVLSLHDPKSFGGTEQHECVTWLDNQPPASVVFLCFGSEGSMPPTQVKEIATALERTGLRFLWVLRSPPPPPPPEHHQQAEKLPSQAPVDANLEDLLPEGFLERSRGRGLVWPKFAPQKQILSHQAVGGFLTHCGWNSCLESLWFGVPMVGWPLYAEQHFNAASMDAEMGVAIALEVDRKGGNWATAEEVERGLRCLMVEDGCKKGMKTRAKALQMKEDGRRALQEGGSSFLSLAKWAMELGKLSIL